MRRDTEIVPRLATSADNAALLELFGSVPMRGTLVLATRRSPDFFALYAMQSGTAECYVGDGEGGKLDGMGTLLVRDGFLRGQPARVGYLGDLRARFGASRRAGLSRFYGKVLEEARARHGCDQYLTAVLADNAAALNALVRRRKQRAGQPVYHLLRRYTATSIQFAGRRRRARGEPAFQVRTAEPADLPRLESFLAEDHRRRPFGYRFDQGELRHRLERWPGFSLERTYLAFDGSGELAGCASAWDPCAVKRFQVLAYRGEMRWAKLGFNAMARLLGFVRLPAEGSEFRYFYLCNVSVRRDDPEVLRSLLSRIYGDFRGRGYHFFTLYLDEDDPLRPAIQKFWTRELRFHLYAVTLSEAPPPDLGEGRTGFEIALA